MRCAWKLKCSKIKGGSSFSFLQRCMLIKTLFVFANRLMQYNAVLAKKKKEHAEKAFMFPN